MQLSQLKDQILNSNNPIIITTHQNPDGDGLGCEVALAHCLKKLGKDVTVANQDPASLPFKFLEEYCEIKPTSDVNIPEYAQIILVDVHDLESTGQVIRDKILSLQHKEIFFINHHSPKYFESEYNYMLFDSASSTGEIIYKLIKDEFKVPLDKVIAESIYTAIISDTRSFRYSKTTSYSHEIAAELIDFGIQTEKIQLEVFGSNKLNQIHLLGVTLKNIKLSNSGKIASTFIPYEAMVESNLTANDTKGFINHLLTIKGIEIAVLLRQDSKDFIKVSLRSKGNYPIYDLAEEYGGGGHKFAASFTSNMPHDILLKNIIEKLEKLTVETLN